MEMWGEFCRSCGEQEKASGQPRPYDQIVNPHFTIRYQKHPIKTNKQKNQTSPLVWREGQKTLRGFSIFGGGGRKGEGSHNFNPAVWKGQMCWLCTWDKSLNLSMLQIMLQDYNLQKSCLSVLAKGLFSLGSSLYQPKHRLSLYFLFFFFIFWYIENF